MINYFYVLVKKILRPQLVFLMDLLLQKLIITDYIQVMPVSMIGLI